MSDQAKAVVIAVVIGTALGSGVVYKINADYNWFFRECQAAGHAEWECYAMYHGGRAK